MKFLSTKNSLLIALLFTVVLVAFVEPSRFILFLGRFHPVILHLPIGALILTLFIDIVGRIKNNYPTQVVQYALGFSTFFAILACILGYFLSFEGGYDENTLNNHLWLGVISTVLITGLLLLSRSKSKVGSKLFLPFFILTFIGITVTGHYGSILTHGSEFLTQYAKAPPKIKPITQIDSLRIYDNVIANILDEKCVQCHNTTKRKGELALNAPVHILEGGEHGEVILRGDAQNSPLYKSINLPLSDDYHMPPEGKPQLTNDEKWLIAYWINNNADFNTKMAGLPRNDTLNKKLEKYLVFQDPEIDAAPFSVINKVRAAGFSVFELVPEQPELSVKYEGAEITDDALKVLEKLSDQVVELDLSHTSLTDDMTTRLKAFKHLKKLYINNTKITDGTLENLYNSKFLNVLNVYGTGITNTGLDALLQHIVPKRIYVWQTEVDNETIAALESKYQSDILSGVDDDFVEMTNLEPPAFSSDKNLFVDTMSVRLISKIKNTKTYYTVDGTEPDSTSLLYKDSIFLNRPLHLKVKAYKEGWLPSETIEKHYFRVKQEVANYTLVNLPDDRYPGSDKLFDLKEGSSRFRDGNWIGFSGDNVDATIDLESITSIDKISVNCLEDVGSWILFPKKLSVYSSLDKDSGFKKMGELKINRKGRYGNGTEIKKYTVDIPDTEARYLRVVVENYKTLPSWHEGAGTDAWLFIDEILIQ
ncbi:c-type cytochrome domain-containing protein [Aestuariivivens sediminicola]|uniref:c-type cytochrome domain-containing protein n=1 Tax=Aestuariivivens sediminicola TaxID=2913560 RepID=UPI001F5878E8|nr:c-type cytochrome domain-containing protein [Aestuariivivens sediminicola]